MLRAAFERLAKINKLQEELKKICSLHGYLHTCAHTCICIHICTHAIHKWIQEKEKKTLFLGQFKDPSPLVMSCVHYDSLTVTDLHMMLS